MTGEPTVALMVARTAGPRARPTVAPVAFPGCTTAVLMVVPTVAPMGARTAGPMVALTVARTAGPTAALMVAPADASP
jgi:hypothetical protein